MTFDYYEGPAGTGKTHNIVQRASEFIEAGFSVEGNRILALTFMNGSRRRLEAKLGSDSIFRNKFECVTFDVFARSLSYRRRSLICDKPELSQQAGILGDFDGPCFLAGALLSDSVVSNWVASAYPVVIVDEAQDLDAHRLRIMKGLAKSSSIIAAADAFQCLDDAREPTETINWLESQGTIHRLTQTKRTTQTGLLAAALAVREGRDIKSVLKRTGAKTPTWAAEGVRLLEVNGNAGLLAWAIASEMVNRNGQTVILSPDARSSLVRGIVDKVSTQTYQWRKSGQTFGPFPITWDQNDSEATTEILSGLSFPATGKFDEMVAALQPISDNSAVANAIARMHRLRRACGKFTFSSDEVAAFVSSAVRDQTRWFGRTRAGSAAMNIHRAKNREFRNVILLWPQSATGSKEHLRRLLYNGITRAMVHCSIVVFGKSRSDQPPFSS